MNVRIEVVAQDPGDPPPAAAPVRVEIRDVSLQDAPATTLAVADAEVAYDGEGGPLAACELEIDVEPGPDALVAWVLVDADGDGQVSVGDWVSFQSHPVADGATVVVPVRRVPE